MRTQAATNVSLHSNEPLKGQVVSHNRDAAGLCLAAAAPSHSSHPPHYASRLSLTLSTTQLRRIWHRQRINTIASSHIYTLDISVDLVIEQPIRKVLGTETRWASPEPGTLAVREAETTLQPIYARGVCEGLFEVVARRSSVGQGANLGGSEAGKGLRRV